MADIDVSTPSDSVSVLESVTLGMYTQLKQLDTLRIPVRSLSGSFSKVFTAADGLRIPVRSGLGYFGARLREERIPTRTVSANVADPSIGLAGGVNTSPVWSGTGRFGSRLESRIPFRTLDASFDLAGIFSLDAVIPTRSLNAAFKYPSSFTLNRQTPIWIGQGNLELTEPAASLSVKIPGAFVFTGEMHEVGGFRLARNIPVRGLESSIYSGEMWLSADIPAWIMGGVVGGGTDASISYHSRFTDYVLRYLRP
jgi:hypothetical protein